MTHPLSLIEQLKTIPGADLRDLNNADLSAIRRQLDQSLYLFSTLVCGNNILDPLLHGELCAYIEHLGQPGYERLITQIPRDHLKSTVGTIYHALWRITRAPDQPVAIFNEAEDNVKNWMGSIRSIVATSTAFQLLYKDLIPPGVRPDDPRSTPKHFKWGDNQIDFEGRRPGDPEHSISAYGAGSAVVGHHWPILILDDIIGLKHQESPAEMERARSWFRHSPYLMRPAERGLAYKNCTPWGFRDVSYTATQEMGFKLYRRSALEDPETGAPDVLNGLPIYPSRFTRDGLLTEFRRGLKADGAMSFMAQRMCLPLPGVQRSFSPAWVRRGEATAEAFHILDYDPSILRDPRDPLFPPPRTVPLHHLAKAIFVDPAASDPAGTASREPNARTAIVVEGIDTWGRRYILDLHVGREDPKTVIDHMFRLAALWSVRDIYIEEVAFSNIYRAWLTDLQRPGRQYAAANLVPRPLKPGRAQKDVRIESKIPGWRQGHYYINTNAAEIEELIIELTQYPNGLTRDILDALGYDSALTPGIPPDVARQRATARRQPCTTVCGY